MLTSMVSLVLPTPRWAAHRAMLKAWKGRAIPMMMKYSVASSRVRPASAPAKRISGVARGIKRAISRALRAMQITMAVRTVALAAS